MEDRARSRLSVFPAALGDGQAGPSGSWFQATSPCSAGKRFSAAVEVAMEHNTE